MKYEKNRGRLIDALHGFISSVMLILSTRKKGNHQVIVGPQNRGKAQVRRYLFLRHGDSHIPLLGHKAQKISLSRQSGKLVLPTVYVYVGHTTQ